MPEKALSRRLARLQAVQTLYQMELSGMSAHEALLCRPESRPEDDAEVITLPPVDEAFLQELVMTLSRY